MGDQVDQSLSEVAADGSVVVAVGYDKSANRNRPLFLRSADGGRSWQRASEDPATQDTSGGGETASRVVHGPSGFVALGMSGSSYVTWLSKDGRRWQRSAIDDAIIRRDESASDLAVTPDGFMIIGQSRHRRGNLLGFLLTWSSPDGQHWTRHEIATETLSGSVGVPTLAQLVVGKHEMIMTGDLENSADTDQPNRIVILRSTDNGTSWTKINISRNLANPYRAYARDLVYVDGQYFLLAQGHGADNGHSWDALVLSGGPHGTSWRRAAAPAALGSKADDYGEVLLPIPSADTPSNDTPSNDTASKHPRWVVGGSVGKSPSDGLIAIGDRLDKLRRLSVGPLTGPRSQEIFAGVVSNEAAVLIGSDGRTGSDDPMILRVQGNTVTRVRIGDLTGSPVPKVSQLVATGNGYRAVGTVNGTPSMWTSTDGLSWKARVLPARGRDDVTEATASALAAGPNNTALAVGTLIRNRGSRLGVWRIAADGQAQQIKSAAFISPVSDDYGYLWATSVAYGPGGWVISAQHIANGRHDIWLLHSTDGRHWTKGRGTVEVNLDPGDVRDHRTDWAAFRAPANGDIIASRVVAVGHGFIALGAIFDKTLVRPVAWRSNDGVTWSEPEDLPLPSGVSDVQVGAALVAGTSVIATGQSAPRVATADRHRLSWRLDLAGKAPTGSATWHLGSNVAADSSISSMLAVKDGFLGVGSQMVNGADDARWWRSSDGLEWAPIPVPRDRTSGPGDQRIEGVLTSGSGLLLWGWNVPPTGGGDYTVQVLMPR